MGLMIRRSVAIPLFLLILINGTVTPFIPSVDAGTLEDELRKAAEKVQQAASNPNSITPVYVYVDELPEWADYAANVMYESTKAWQDANPGLKFYIASNPQQADFVVKWVKEFGTEYVGYAYGNLFIEVALGDSNCKEKWQPYSSNYIVHIMEHEIGHVFGYQHSSDPDSIMYPIVLNLEYGEIAEEFTLTERYAQFVSLCSNKEITSYNYQVKTDDPTYGFDVYFVPSINELQRWQDGKSFRYYSGKGCFGEQYLSYSGTCDGVEKGSGLFIIMDSKVTNPLTKITVTQQEIQLQQNFVQPTASITKSYQQPIPDLGSQFNPYEKDYSSGHETMQPSNSQYEEMAYLAKSAYESKIEQLKSGITRAENSLSGLVYENPEAQKKIKQAWDVRWQAIVSKNNAEKKLGDGLTYMNDGDWRSAYFALKDIDPDAESVGKSLKWITGAINDAEKMENEYQLQKESKIKEENKAKSKFCFLFWCW